jgi:hypothetical protein
MFSEVRISHVLRLISIYDLLTLPRIFTRGTPALALDVALPTTVEVSHIAIEGKTVVAREVGCDFKPRVVSDKPTLRHTKTASRK